MSGRVLDVPSLSQLNPLYPTEIIGRTWCGRASASMIYNSYQLVEYGERGRDQFITNDRDERELVYPTSEDGNSEPAALGDAGEFLLYEPFHRVLEARGESTQGQAAKEVLFPLDHAYRSDLPLGEQQTRDVLQPVIESIEDNNPVLTYTGLSANPDTPRHIVVLSGYRVREDALWVLIDDPYVFEDPDDANKWGSIDVERDLQVQDAARDV